MDCAPLAEKMPLSRVSVRAPIQALLLVSKALVGIEAPENFEEFGMSEQISPINALVSGEKRILRK